MPNIVALCVVIPDTRGGAMISFVPFSYTGHSEVAAPSKYVDTAAIMRTDGASNIMLIISDQEYNRSPPQYTSLTLVNIRYLCLLL